MLLSWFWIVFIFGWTQPALAIQDSSVFFRSDSYIKENFLKISPAIAQQLITSGVIRSLYKLTPSRSKYPIPDHEKSSSFDEVKALERSPTLGLVHQLFQMIPGDTETVLAVNSPRISSFHFKPALLGELVQLAMTHPNQPQIIISHLLPKMMDPQISTEIFDSIVPQVRALEAPGCSPLPLLDPIQKFSTELSSIRSKNQEVKFESLIRLQAKVDQAFIQLREKKEIQRKKTEDACPSQNPALPHLLLPTLPQIGPCDEYDVQERLRLLLKAFSPKIDPYRPHTLIKTFLESIQECARPDSVFPKEFPYQLILAHLLIKSEEYKVDLEPFFQNLTRALTPDYDPKPSSWLSLVTPIFPDDFYKSWTDRVIQLNSPLQGDLPTPVRLKKHILLEQGLLSSMLAKARTHSEAIHSPQLMNQNITDVKFGIDTPSTRGYPQYFVSSDCCEATFSNFPARFGPTKLQTDAAGSTQRYDWDSLKPQGVQVNPDFISIFSQSYYNFSNHSIRQTFREHWKGGTSNIPEVSYYNHTQIRGISYHHDMKPTVDNFLGMMEHFFKYPKKAFSTRQQRLEHLGKLFHVHVEVSHPEGVPSEAWTNVQLRFFKEPRIPGAKADLTFEIGKDHCRALAPADRIDPPWAQALRSKIHGRDFAEIKRTLHEVSPENQEIFSRSLALLIDNRSEEEMAKWTFLVDSHLSSQTTLPREKFLFPLLAQFPLNTQDGIWEFAYFVLERKLERYYPWVFRYLEFVSKDEHGQRLGTQLIKNYGTQLPEATYRKRLINLFKKSLN